MSEWEMKDGVTYPMDPTKTHEQLHREYMESKLSELPNPEMEVEA